jgi:hypothetical protein
VNFVRRQFPRKVYDYDRIKRAFLYADTAACAEVFGNDCLAVFGPLDYALATCLVYWAVDDTF